MKKILALAVVLLAVGCKLPENTPVANPTTSITKTEQAIDATVGHIVKAEKQLPKDTPPVVHVELSAAKTTAGEAKQSNQETEQQAKAIVDDNAKLREAASNHAQAISDEKKKTADEKQKRIEAEQKYSEAWLGGRALAWIKGISITLTVLGVVGLLLNYYTDAFVHLAKPVVWVVVGVIGGALKAVWQALMYCIKGIGKLLRKMS